MGNGPGGSCPYFVFTCEQNVVKGHFSDRDVRMREMVLEELSGVNFPGETVRSLKQYVQKMAVN